MKLMHLPRTHRIDAAAVSEQFSRGIVELQHERTRNEAADIGTKRFTYPLAWVKVLYLVNVVTPKFWTAKRCRDYLDSTFSDSLPLEPGGILRPRLGPSSALRRGPAAPSKKMHQKKKRPSPSCILQANKYPSGTWRRPVLGCYRGCPRPSRGGERPQPSCGGECARPSRGSKYRYSCYEGRRFQDKLRSTQVNGGY
jgi:hypothetical protein